MRDLANSEWIFDNDGAIIWPKASKRKAFNEMVSLADDYVIAWINDEMVVA